MWFTDDENQALVDMYNAGVKYEKMAEVLDRSVGSINWRIGKLIEQGTIKRRARKEPEQKAKGETPVQGIRPKPTIQANNSVVNCNKQIKKKCYYGQKSEPYMCNYCLVEGHSRGCSARACTHYTTSKTDLSKVKEAIEESERQKF